MTYLLDKILHYPTRAEFCLICISSVFWAMEFQEKIAFEIYQPLVRKTAQIQPALRIMISKQIFV